MINELPLDLNEFIRNGFELVYDVDACEAGQIGLESIQALKLGNVWTDPAALVEETNPLIEHDPSYYEIPAISLTGTCDDYDPEYILLWLPNERQYGSWDCDHWILYVFPNVSWSDIVNDPLPYINAQWDSNSTVRKLFNPSQYQLQIGKPF